jgi:uncharacterized protein with transglutaminase domain
MKTTATLVQVENSQSGNTRQRTWLLWVLFLIPLIIALGKLPKLPTAAVFGNLFSLADTPKHMHRHLEYLFFVPLSGIVVSFFRLTLGISVLSFFRPILIAIAFRAMGVEIGLAFLIAALVVVVLVRRLLRDVDYYTRVPVLVSLLVSLMAVALVCGRFWHLAWMQRLSYFPVIALCLTCESFAKLLGEKGSVEAVWRTATTIVVGLAITGVANIPGAMQAMLRFPELLIAQAGMVLFIDRFLNYRPFEGRNLLHMALKRLSRDEATPGLDPQEAIVCANLTSL